MSRDSATFERTVQEAIRRAKLLFAPLVANQSSSGNASGSQPGLVPPVPTDATQFLNGASPPAFAKVKDSDLSLSNIATNDVSITKHGFCPIAPNDTTKFLRGDGTWAAVAGAMPTFPAISNLELRLSAVLSTITTADSGRISQVNDISGNNRHFGASLTSRPRYLKSHFNSAYPGWYCDGGVTRLSGLSTFTIPQPLTVVSVVHNYQGGTANENLYRDSNGGCVGFVSGGNSYAIFAGTATQTSTTLFNNNRSLLPGSDTGVAQVRQDIFNGANSFMRSNGVETTPSNVGTSGISGTLGVMGDQSTSFAKGIMYEFLIFGKALNASERAQIDAYYAAACGIVSP
jgi:hypothetical protein